MSKKTKALKPSTYKTFLVFYGITILLSIIMASIFDIPMGMGGIGPMMLLMMGFIATGPAAFLISLYILYKAAKNKESRKYAIICVYGLLAVIISAIILFVAHNILPRTGIEYSSAKKVQGSAFVTYTSLNIIGIIHTIIVFVKNRK